MRCWIIITYWKWISHDSPCTLFLGWNGRVPSLMLIKSTTNSIEGLAGSLINRVMVMDEVHSLFGCCESEWGFITKAHFKLVPRMDREKERVGEWEQECRRKRKNPRKDRVGTKGRQIAIKIFFEEVLSESDVLSSLKSHQHAVCIFTHFPINQVTSGGI